jgi:hypothetical protein
MLADQCRIPHALKLAVEAPYRKSDADDPSTSVALHSPGIARRRNVVDVIAGRATIDLGLGKSRC